MIWGSTKFHSKHSQTCCQAYPSIDFSRGITNLTKLTSNENIGMLFVLVILSHYDDGWDVLQSSMNRRSNTANVKDVIELLEAFLCMHTWLKQDKMWPLNRQEYYAWHA